ncbi:DUF1016 N-terminal domain-containing protein [Niabella aquatica]
MLTKHKQTIKELKSVILRSRYRAATLANKELLLLYFSVGRLIVERSETESWGSGVLDRIATDLQAELPGLRGFSTTSLKKMRLFYTEWMNSILPSATDELSNLQKKTRQKNISKIDNLEFSPLLTDQFKKAFFSIGFTHHYEILVKAKSVDERVFYIHKTFEEFLSVDNLINSIKSNTFKKRGTLLNNFSQTIIDESYREKALLSFKDEYLFDFMNIEDADFVDEREIENEIVRNIRKFILSIGSDGLIPGYRGRHAVPIAIESKEASPEYKRISLALLPMIYCKHDDYQSSPRPKGEVFFKFRRFLPPLPARSVQAGVPVEKTILFVIITKVRYCLISN